MQEKVASIMGLLSKAWKGTKDVKNDSSEEMITIVGTGIPTWRYNTELVWNYISMIPISSLSPPLQRTFFCHEIS